jgi:hypothetical protein
VTARVTDVSGNPAPGRTVTVGVDVVQYSGGHHHDDGNRPKGTLSPRSGVTDTNGEFRFTFTAPEAAGAHVITAHCDQCTNTATGNIDVKVPDLVVIPRPPLVADLPGPLYVLMTPNSDTNHPDNHDIMNGEPVHRLMRLAERYRTVFPDALPLYLNDSSIQWGGVFDCFMTCAKSHPWTFSHKEHRRGSTVDVKSTGPEGLGKNRDAFEQMVKRIGGNVYPEGSHPHVRLLGIWE